MTREEAIKSLQFVRNALDNSMDITKAYEMAIKTLKQEPCFWEKCPYYEPDMMFDGKDEYDMGKCTYKQEPKIVPIAEIKFDDDMLREIVEDAISRQAVLERREILKDKQGTGYQAVKTKYIRELPSVNPQEPKTGHWIKISPAGIYECSECGQNVMTSDICAYKFCHGCGAKMFEPQESEDKE